MRGRQYGALDRKKHGEKLLLFPSSLLWLLNLVQKELTSKHCSETHNSRVQCILLWTQKRNVRNNIKLKGVFMGEKQVFAPVDQ